MGDSVREATVEDVIVTGEYLTESDGYNYGAQWYLSSDVNETTCVVPYVVIQENVYGSVTTNPVLLGPNEKRFSIGSFQVSDRKKPWKSLVRAKWKKGTC